MPSFTDCCLLHFNTYIINSGTKMKLLQRMYFIICLKEKILTGDEVQFKSRINVNNTDIFLIVSL